MPRNDGVKPVARPTKYSTELADNICLRMAGGESVNSICKDESMPARSTVMLWVASDREGFSDKYDKACHARAHYWADELLDIADDATNDYMDRVDKEGGKESAINPEAIARSRLRVDTRKWLLSKMLPKFSDKPEPPQSGDMTELLAQLISKLPS